MVLITDINLLNKPLMIDNTENMESAKVLGLDINSNHPRRNPVRNARLKPNKLAKDHILEDFSILDSIHEEEKDMDKENKKPNKKSAPQFETNKQWSVNAHEPPQYRTETKVIGALETDSIKSKSKKKNCTRKRKPRARVPKKGPNADLKVLVNSTTDLLKTFKKNVKESNRLINPVNRSLEKCRNDNISEILKNQKILFSIVNGLV